MHQQNQNAGNSHVAVQLSTTEVKKYQTNFWALNMQMVLTDLKHVTSY